MQGESPVHCNLTRLLVTHLKELRKTVTEALVNITQQIKDLPIIQTIKDKFEELGVMEQVLTLMKSIHEKIYTILPNAETKQFAGAMYEYVQKSAAEYIFLGDFPFRADFDAIVRLEKASESIERISQKLRQVKVDDAAELRVIFEKLAAAVTSLLQGARQKLGEIGMPSLYGLAMPQLTDFFGNFGSTPSFEGSSSFSLINQALSGELPSALDLIKAYRPRYINPLDEVPNKLRAVVVNGQHIFTFDGRHLTFPGSCRYVLAHDYVDQNFTLLIQLQNGLPKALVLEDKTGSVVELKENGQVALNGVNHGFPVMEKDLFAFRETNGRIGLGTSYGLIARCTSRLTVCYIEVSGYYFNKLRGLLGDGNNEPYTDFKLPSGRVATSEAEFGNSYRLAASCPQVRTPDHSHHLSSLPAACEQVFSGQSPLRPLSLLLDVDPFKQACTHACTANPGKALQEACDLARGYAALAVTGLLPAVVPPACVQCNDADKPRKLGEEYTLELPAKQADIIVAVETTMETERIFKNIAVPVLSQVVDSLKSKRINDIKVHLVGITSKMPYPIVYDTDQKLKTAKVKFEDPSRYSYPKFLREHKRQRRYAQQAAEAPRPAFDVIEFLSHLGIDNVIAGYMSLLEIPVRAGAVKTTISVVGEKCRKRSFLADVILGVATVPMFKAQDHTQNIIAPVGDLKFDGRESTVIAYDSHSVLVYGDKTRGKDTQELRRKLFNPPDSCTDYTELNDGLVISATNFERNAAQQKEFVQAAGLAIVDRMLSQRRTQSCICAYADPFSARSFCVPTSVKQVGQAAQEKIEVQTDQPRRRTVMFQT
ncbi:Apolipophorins [Eumeta japonica]|uniref:Apolipophorins n=1 Tax=Eumeta variegata TaxID=151549 RepID=A0A4C1YRU7_EUMVA|nr:Apolipophorins [Eumeta japonica]